MDSNKRDLPLAVFTFIGIEERHAYNKAYGMCSLEVLLSDWCPVILLYHYISGSDTTGEVLLSLNRMTLLPHSITAQIRIRKEMAAMYRAFCVVFTG